VTSRSVASSVHGSWTRWPQVRLRNGRGQIVATKKIAKGTGRVAGGAFFLHLVSGMGVV